MGRLIYSAILSLDGCVADSRGCFEELAPDEEVHAFVNEQERGVGTYLYGRRMYDVMRVWQTMPEEDGDTDAVRDYADIWRAADKVVYSTSLPAVSTERTSIERSFDADAIRAKKEAAERDLSVGGPHLAGQAMAAGLVDECHLFVCPVTLGGGTRALPADLRLDLGLVDERRFGSGVVHLHYRVRPA